MPECLQVCDHGISTHVPHKRYDQDVESFITGIVKFQLTYLTRGTT